MKLNTDIFNDGKTHNIKWAHGRMWVDGIEVDISDYIIPDNVSVSTVRTVKDVEIIQIPMTDEDLKELTR